jgi:galactokinase
MLDPQLPADLRQFHQQIKIKLGGVFAPGRPIFLARAPGRLDVLGGIAELAGAAVLQYPIADAVIVAVQRRLDKRILIRNLNLNKERVLTVEHRLDDLLEAVQQQDWSMLRSLASPADRAWTGRVLAALALLLDRLPEKGKAVGVNIAIQSMLPAGAGLGSSASLLVALLLALQEAYALALEDAALTDICQKVERQILQQGCGSADFLTILLGRQESIAVLQGQPVEIKSGISVPEGVQLLAIDTGVRKIAGCQKMNELCATLWIGRALLLEALASDAQILPIAGYLDNIPRDDWQRGVKKLVPYRYSGEEFLRLHAEAAEGMALIDPEKKYMPRNIIEFVIEENARVQEFIKSLQEAADGPSEANLSAAGELLFISHRHYTKVSGAVCGEADWLIDELQAMGPSAGIYGARAMPGGAASSVVVLAKSACGDQLHNLVSRYENFSMKTARIAGESSPGARAIGVITAFFES